MLEDKDFFNKEVTPSVANLIDIATIMLHNRTPVKKIYEYLLAHSKDYRERYISLFLFGIAYQGYKEDNHLK